MSRLYFRIYLYFLVIIVAFGAIGAVGWLAYTHDDRRLDRIDALGRLAAKSLPEDHAEVSKALGRLASEFHVNLALHGPTLRRSRRRERRFLRRPNQDSKGEDGAARMSARF